RRKSSTRILSAQGRESGIRYRTMPQRAARPRRRRYGRMNTRNRFRGVLLGFEGLRESLVGADIRVFSIACPRISSGADLFPLSQMKDRASFSPRSHRGRGDSRRNRKISALTEPKIHRNPASFSVKMANGKWQMANER